MSKLTAYGRAHIARSNFAEPRHRGEPKSVRGHYPIHDKAHARNAIARVHQHGTRAEIKLVEAKVHRRYPSIKITGYARRHRRK